MLCCADKRGGDGPRGEVHRRGGGRGAGRGGARGDLARARAAPRAGLLSGAARGSALLRTPQLRNALLAALTPSAPHQIRARQPAAGMLARHALMGRPNGIGTSRLPSC